MNIDRKKKRPKDRGQDTPILRQKEDRAPPPKETRTKKTVRQETNQKRAVSRSIRRLKERSTVSNADDGWMG